jgi:hypothetical protein
MHLADFEASLPADGKVVSVPELTGLEDVVRYRIITRNQALGRLSRRGSPCRGPFRLEETFEQVCLETSSEVTPGLPLLDPETLAGGDTIREPFPANHFSIPSSICFHLIAPVCGDWRSCIYK